MDSGTGSTCAAVSFARSRCKTNYPEDIPLWIVTTSCYDPLGQLEDCGSRKKAVLSTATGEKKYPFHTHNVILIRSCSPSENKRASKLFFINSILHEQLHKIATNTRYTAEQYMWKEANGVAKRTAATVAGKYESICEKKESTTAKHTA